MQMNRDVNVTTTGKKKYISGAQHCKLSPKSLYKLHIASISHCIIFILTHNREGKIKTVQIINPTTDNKQNMENEQYRDWRREKERVQVREGMEKRDRYACMYPATDEQ